MLEVHVLKYISTPRTSKNGGEAAIVVNCFSVEKLNVIVPNGLEVVYGLLKPKCGTALYKKIILSTLHQLREKIESWLIILCVHYTTTHVK